MQNKRRHPRFTVEGLVGKVTSVAQVDVVNLSLSGVAIRAEQRLNIGREYTLRLELDESAMQVRGTVVWSTLSGLRPDPVGERRPQYSAGLRFNDVLNEKVLGIMKFIDAHKIMHENRLGGLRFQIDTAGALLDSPETYRVRLISMSGMLIETSRELAVGTDHPMELLPDGRDPIAFTGRVAPYVKAAGTPGRWEIGVEFVDMTAEHETILQGFILTLAGGQPPA
jgi:Tfp pilus assembly protein PilZ